MIARLIPRRPAFIVVAVLLLVGVVAFFAFVLPSLMVTSADVPNTSKRVELQNDVRGTLVQLLAGVVLVFAPYYFTSRREAIDREDRITDSYAKAVGQLGDESLDVRVGGIYALERIARESRRDHGPIVEVLTSYLRTHAPQVDARAR